VNSPGPRHLLHTRAYEIESVFEDDQHFRLIGHLRDVNPNGLWGIDDSDPMIVHHMQVELLLEAGTMTIKDVTTQMHVRPNVECRDTLPKYEQLIGLSIARGFTHKVREMFGGPRACTHIGALLNAMAPVAIQSMWPFTAWVLESRGPSPEVATTVAVGPDAARARAERAMLWNRNTCHVWAEDGPMFKLLNAGGELPPPLWAVDRLHAAGIPLEKWTEGNS
jgi:Protein of unknown function (DUF2889)